MGLPKGPDGIAISPDGRRASVTDAAASKVSVLSTRTGKVLARYATGTGPMHVALNQAGTAAWITNFWDGTVSVLDTRTGNTIKTIRTGRAATWICWWTLSRTRLFLITSAYSRILRNCWV